MQGQELKPFHCQSDAVACTALSNDPASLLPNTVYVNPRRSTKVAAHPSQLLKCPRCDSTDTKFCYYNNYSLTQPRYFCKTCKRYWTAGGTLRNVPVGGGLRKNKKSKLKAMSEALLSEHLLQHQQPQQQHLSGEAASSGAISGQVPKPSQNKALPSPSQQQSSHVVVPDMTNIAPRNALMPLMAAPDTKVAEEGTACRQFGMGKSTVWQQTMSTASCGNYNQYQQNHHSQHPHQHQHQHHEDHLHFHPYRHQHQHHHPHHHQQMSAVLNSSRSEYTVAASFQQHLPKITVDYTTSGFLTQAPLEPAQVGLEERDNMHQPTAIELPTGFSAKFCKEEDAISGGNPPYDWQAVFDELFGGTESDQLPGSISAAGTGGSWAHLSRFSDPGPC